MENDITTYIILVCGFVKKGNKYLIGLRNPNDAQSGGSWELLGGKVEVKVEDINMTGILEKTFVDELKEEAGIEVENIKYLNHNWAFKRSSGHIVIGMLFEADYKSGEAKPIEGHSEVGWFSIDEMRKMNDKKYFQIFLDKLHSIL